MDLAWAFERLSVTWLMNIHAWVPPERALSHLGWAEWVGLSLGWRFFKVSFLHLLPSVAVILPF